MNYWPGWSEARRNPSSVMRKLVNPYSLQMDGIELIATELDRSLSLLTADPDSFIYRAWTVADQDVSVRPEEYDTNNRYLENVTAINGIVSGQTIALEPLTPEGFRVANPTSFFVSGSLSLDDFLLSGELHMGEYNPTDGEFLVTTVSGSLGGIPSDPSYHHAFTLPERFSNIRDAELGFRTFRDSEYEDIELTFEVPISGTRFVLDYHLKGIPTEITRTIDDVESVGSGVTYTNTQSWARNYISDADIDKDGIIDSREIELVNANLGERYNPGNAQDWEDNFAIYDVNHDGVIDSKDLAIVQHLSGTIRADGGDILEFAYPGTYTVEFSIPLDGYAATSSFYRDATGKDVRVVLAMEPFRNETFNHLKTNFPDGYVDTTYDPNLNVFYYLDNTTKAVYAVNYDSTGGVKQTYKIILPYEHKDMDFRGITYIDGLIYVLVVINGVPWIYLLQADYANPETSLVKLPVHSGDALSSDPDIYIRDSAGLTSGVTALGSIDNDRLVTIDENKIKVLYPLFDVYSAEVDAETNKTSMFFREKYEELDTSPSGTINQTYFHIWNVFDEFAFERGLTRYPGEDNSSLKTTCLDVYENKWTMDLQGVHYGLSRALRSDPYILSGSTHFQLNTLPAADRIDGTMLRFNNVPVYWDTVTEEKVFKDSAYLYSTFVFYSGSTEIFQIHGDILVVNEETLV